MKITSILGAVLLAGLSILLLANCRRAGNVADSEYNNYAEVKKKLASFDRGEITLEEVTSTGPGEADAEWVRSLVGYYLAHSNEMTVKMKLPISRCFGVMGEYPEALKLAHDYVSVYSNDWQGWRIIGAANFKQENLIAAVNAYTNAVQLGDDASCDVLAVAALKADRLDAFPLVVPRLLLEKNSRETERGKRLEIAMLLVVYSLKANSRRSS